MISISSLKGLGQETFDIASREYYNKCIENCSYAVSRGMDYDECIAKCRELSKMTEEERTSIQTEQIQTVDAPRPFITISPTLKRTMETKIINMPVQEEIPQVEMTDIISQQVTEQYILGIPMSKIKQYAPYVIIGGGALTLLYFGLRKKK